MRTSLRILRAAFSLAGEISLEKSFSEMPDTFPSGSWILTDDVDDDDNKGKKNDDRCSVRRIDSKGVVGDFSLRKRKRVL